MRYVIYTRASTDKDNTISHEMQLNDCLKLIGQSSYLHFTEDDVSGDADLKDRPGLMNAIEALKKGDTLIVWKLNRLARDPYRQGMIIALVAKKGAKIQSCMQPSLFEENAEAELQRNIYASIAKYELETIRHNVRKAMKSAKESGRCVGRIPYGYGYKIKETKSKGMVKQTKWLFPIEQEQAIIDRMFQFKERGFTYREMAKELNDEGLLNREGTHWTYSAVYRILKNAEKHREVEYQIVPA